MKFVCNMNPIHYDTLPKVFLAKYYVEVFLKNWNAKFLEPGFQIKYSLIKKKLILQSDQRPLHNYARGWVGGVLQNVINVGWVQRAEWVGVES